MIRKMFTALIAAAMLMPVIPAAAQEYPAGGYQATEDFESGGNYSDDTFGIGKAYKTSDTYIGMKDTEGIVLYKGTAIDGRKYNREDEGPGASFIIEYDLKFENSNENNIPLQVRFYDESAFSLGKTHLPFNFPFASTNMYNWKNGEWYRMRHEVYVNNDKNGQINNYSTWVNGTKILSNQKYGTYPATTSSLQKSPNPDYLEFVMMNANGASYILDNISCYKANVNAPMTVNKGELIAEIRKDESIYKSAVFGTGEKEYPIVMKAHIEEALAAAEDEYYSADSTSESVDNAVSELRRFMSTFETNGALLTLGTPVFKNESDTDITGLQGQQSVKILAPVTFSKYAESVPVDVTLTAVLYDKDSKKIYAVSDSGTQQLVPAGDNKAQTYNLETSFDLSGYSESEKEKMNIRFMVFDNYKSLKPYFIPAYIMGEGYESKSAETDETVDESIDFAKDYIDDTTADLKITVNTAPKGSVVFMLLKHGSDIENVTKDDILFIDQKNSGDDGSAVFDALIDDSIGNSELPYVFYTTASANTHTGKIEYTSAAVLNKVFSEIYANRGNAAEAWKCIVNNADTLSLGGALSEMYIKSDSVPERIIGIVTQKQYTYIESTEFLTLLTEQMRKEAINYLNSDSELVILLDKDSPINILNFMGISGDSEEYKKYAQSDSQTKKKLYAFIRTKNDYTEEKCKNLLADGLIIAEINASASTDRIIKTINENTLRLSNAQRFKSQTGSIQKAAATLILKHSDFVNIDELNSYILTAVNSSTPQTKPAGGGGGGGVSRGNGSVTAGAATVNTPAKTESNISGINEHASPFTDIENHSWAKAAIDMLYRKNVISGKNENEFAPDDKVTREEFVKMAVLLFGISSEDNSCVFTDVGEDSWYRPYVSAAFNNGIINGVTDTLFGSGENLTREQLVTIAYNTALKSGTEFEDEAYYIPFNDDELISDYAENAVHMLASSGIINGIDDNMFMPKGFCTRAEAAKVLYGVYMQNYK